MTIVFQWSMYPVKKRYSPKMNTTNVSNLFFHCAKYMFNWNASATTAITAHGQWRDTQCTAYVQRLSRVTSLTKKTKTKPQNKCTTQGNVLMHAHVNARVKWLCTLCALNVPVGCAKQFAQNLKTLRRFPLLRPTARAKERRSEVRGRV